MDTFAQRLRQLFEADLDPEALEQGVLDAFHDCTERTRDYEARWKALLDASNEGLALSLNGVLIDINDRLAQMLGYERDELIGKSALDLTLSVDVVARNITERIEVPYDVVALRKDGTTFPAELRGRNVTYRGDAARVTAVVDLTPQLELRRSEVRYRELVELLPVMIGEADLEGRLTYINDLALRTFGYESLEEALGAEIGQHIAAEQHAQMYEAMSRRLKGEPTRGTEYTAVRRDGSTFPVILHSGVRSRDGQPFGFRVAMLDISVRVEAENQRRELEAQLRHGQKLESLGLLAGGIAHDFNNLLAVVLGNTEIASAELPPGIAKRRLELVRQAAVKAAELTEQMLAYSGKATFSVSPLDMNALITDMVPLLQVAHDKNVKLTLDLEEGIPAIEGDAAQLRQVVLNLVTNAAEAVAGRRSATVVVGTEAHENTLQMYVNDNGDGMDEATLARIFEPFFSTKFTGRGLGLAAVQGIVHGHGGEIHVDSSPSEGTTFLIEFPAVSEPAAELADEEPTPIPLVTGSVLLVDDDEGVREIAAIMLRHAGYAVIEAGDGARGLELFKEHQQDIDVVLLDMTMPGMSGSETFRALVELDPDVAVVACSGFSGAHATTELKGPQLRGFLQKPYRRADLVRAVGEVVES